MQDTFPTLEFGERALVDRSLSDDAQGLVGSEILKIAGDIRALVAAGSPVCNLTVGDFNAKYFPIPAALADHLHEAVRAGETNYPPSDGVLALRKAITEFVSREWGVQYPVDSVLVASGARPILYAAYRCIVNPGDKVVYPVPSWNNNHYAYMSHAEDICIPTRAEHGFMPTLDQLAPHLSEARVLCLNSPLNPTGTLIGESQLRAITEAIVEENERRTAAGRRHLFLVHDQVYASLVFGSAKHHMPTALVPAAAPWVVSLDGISKAFAGTGLRVGWVLAAPALVSRMKSYLGHVGAWAPRPEQVAVAKFLRDASAVASFRQEMDGRVRERLNALFDGFEAMRKDGYDVECITPQGAIYLSLRLGLIGRTFEGRTIERNDEIRRLVLDEAGVGIVPFQAFGLQEETGWFRLSVGAVSLEEIAEMFPRLRALLDRLG